MEGASGAEPPGSEIWGSGGGLGAKPLLWKYGFLVFGSHGVLPDRLCVSEGFILMFVHAMQCRIFRAESYLRSFYSFFLSYEVKCNRILFFHFLFLVNMPAVSRRESCSIVTSSLNFIGFTPNFSGTFHVLPCYQNQESGSLGGHHCKCPTFLGIRG